MALKSTSLFWRTFLLLMLLLIITALGWLQSFRVLSEVPFSRGVAQQIVSTVNLTRYALISADSDYRPDLLHILAYQEGVRIIPRDENDHWTKLVSQGNIPELIETQTKASLGENTIIAGSVNDQPGLWVSTTIEGDNYWLMIRDDLLDPPFGTAWVWWAFVAFLMGTLGGVFTRLIDRNTTIPARKSQVFSTAADNQPSVDIHVLQGEREMASDNKTIGNFRLDGIAPAPRGVPQIEVTFDIDANGILHVTAKDRGTGKEQKITITANSGLNDEEIEKMVNDAKVHAEQDKAQKEKIEVKNQADSMVYQVEKQLKEFGDKVSPEVKAPVEDGIAKLKKELEADDTEAMKATMKSLEENLMKLGQEIYSQQQQQQQSSGSTADNGGQAGGKNDDDNIVDAEVVDDK